MAEQPTVVNETQTELESEETSIVSQEHDADSGYVIPKGAIAFAVAMILGYIFYFVLIWTDVISRGGGQ